MSITILVLDTKTHKPASGASVSYRKTSIWGGNASGVTDHNGYIHFSGDTGNAELSISYKGRSTTMSAYLSSNNTFYIGGYWNAHHLKKPHNYVVFYKVS